MRAGAGWALAMVALLPGQALLSERALAQAQQTDQELKALIPDAALADPAAWARDTPAAHESEPDIAGLTDFAADLPPLPDLPQISIPWPDSADLAPVEPLSPDPDIGAAEDAVKQANSALDQAVPPTGRDGAQIANAVVEHVGAQVLLAFPPDATLPEREAIVARFAGLSSLKALDKADDSLAQLSRRAREDNDLIQQVLRLYGYYDSEVVQSLVGLGDQIGQAKATDANAKSSDGEKVVVRFDIQPGPRYQLASIALGDIAQSGDAAALRTSFALAVGDPINSDRIVEERGHLVEALGHRGFAFAKVGEPALQIDHDQRNGALSLPVTTGGTYRFGAVTSLLPAYLNSRHLQRIARFRPGQMYDKLLLDDFRKAVLATGLVSSVNVTTRPVAEPVAGQPGTVAVDVALTKAPRRTIAGLIGFSSGEGVRLEASWENRNFFPPEGALKVRGVAGSREQLAGVTFRRSNFLARDQVLTADFYAQTKRTDAYDARTVSFLAGIEKQTTLIFQKPWVYSGGVEILATSELAATAAPGSPRTTYFIGALPLRMGYDGSNDLLDPERGFRVALRVSPEVSVQSGTKSTYAKVQFDASGYLPAGKRLVLAARTRLGTIQGTALDNIAPSRRFYAGGGASVRGFGYQAVGPKDVNGDPIGGRSLSEFSLEARVQTGLMGGAVSIVPFVDAGTVGTSSAPTLSGLRIGAGVGLRYKTTFGPIRFDLGTPLNRRQGDSRIGVYISLGQAF
ncbi:autotransporter assembly complex protein TamA [Novosphingobium sp.]|uniref:autotransporter assembly complex protein TamA n=1 Tax=Novosphingobium sp. TaxID=1874826 RepID=UPI0038B7A365